MTKPDNSASLTGSAPLPGGARHRRRNGIAIFAVLISAAIISRYTIFRPKLVPVTVFLVAKGKVEESVTNSRSGTVKSRHRATLSPETGGRVEALLVKKGQRVQRGDLLLRIFDGDAKAQVEFSQRSLDAVRAGEREACEVLALGERELTRQHELSRQGIASSQLVDQVRSRRDAAASGCEAGRARSRQAEAALALARTTLAKTVLRAPFAGVIAELSTEVGEWITPSPPGLPMPPVVELIDSESIYISAPLDEVDVSKVTEAMPVRVTLDAYPGRSFEGKVGRVAPYVLDKLEQNRTFEVEVTLDDAAFAGQLLPGTSADVEVILAVRDDVLRIPSYGLVSGKRVLVVRDGKLVSVDVETGLRNWAFVEIRKGLSPGDPVVVSLDRPEIKAGARVRVEAETQK